VAERVWQRGLVTLLDRRTSKSPSYLSHAPSAALMRSPTFRGGARRSSSSPRFTSAQSRP
jgi:hypothetical protein